MTPHDLPDARDILFRAYVSNVMTFATLPYHLAQHRSGRREGAFEYRQRSARAPHRREDVRWLR
jgi:hypothetical protein